MKCVSDQRGAVFQFHQQTQEAEFYFYSLSLICPLIKSRVAKNSLHRLSIIEKLQSSDVYPDIIFKQEGIIILTPGHEQKKCPMIENYYSCFAFV